jgi:hypothetical protein
MTVTTTPANILPTGASGGTWIVQNLGTAAIYVARNADAATAAAGVKVGANQAVEFEFSTAGVAAVWAATESGTADVRVIKTS